MTSSLAEVSASAGMTPPRPHPSTTSVAPTKTATPCGRPCRPDGSTVESVDGWEVARGDGGEVAPECDWLPAAGAGGVAEALRAAGRELGDLDADDWWFRTRLAVAPAGPEELLRLHFDGVTPPSTILLDGAQVAEVDSMFVSLTVPVRGDEVVHVRCRALGPLLASPRRPRQRWRTRVADGGLRFIRTTLLGRAPGFAPGPPTVGPWRPVRLERLAGLAVDRLSLLPLIEGDTGRLRASAVVQALPGEVSGVRLVLDGPSGRHEVELHREDDDRWSGELVVPQVARWWPHTHGDPVLHEVQVEARAGAATRRVEAGRVGFRTLAAPTPNADTEVDGLDLHVNGVRTFARGAVWTRPGGLTSTVSLRPVLERLRDAGLNMLRIPGTGAYEDAEFLDLCDELGILLWQDAMLANFDYPAADPDFVASFENETQAVLASLAGRPCFVAFCGGSEIEQQAAMTGLPAHQVRGPLTAEVLPRLLAESRADAVWIPGSPCGGDLPFRTSTGIAHYFGVGGYRRPLTDVRRAQVRFASECLAVANLPAVGLVSETDLLGGLGAPRDIGADWDFADVRDHYLAELHEVDPVVLRSAEPERYLELSRRVSGELMAEVFGEWRRAASPCCGGLVLWACDLGPGAGWGLLDHTGAAKPVLDALARIWAPVAVWTTDEGQDGIDVHVANDRPEPLRAQLDVALRLGDALVDRAECELDLPPHGSWTGGVEALLGRFVDAAYAYRFGPPGHDVLVTTLTGPDGVLSQSIRRPGVGSRS